MGVRTSVIAVLLCAVASTAGAQRPPYEPSNHDLLGRVYLWGPPVDGRRIGLSMASTTLWYGQPVELSVVCPPPSRTPAPVKNNGRYVRVWWDTTYQHHRPTASIEITDGNGIVEHEVELIDGSDGIDTGHRSTVRLRPTGAAAAGYRFRPGTYRMRVRMDQPQQGAYQNSFIGTLVTDWVTVTVLSTQEAARAATAASTARAFRNRFGDFDADEERWVQNEPWLRPHLHTRESLHWIALFEHHANSNDAVVAERARRLLRNTIVPMLEVNRRQHRGSLAVTGPMLGVLGDVSWEIVREYEAGRAYDALRLKAAVYRPLPPYKSAAKPTDAQRAAILKQLAHGDYGVRMRAVRSLGPTSDAKILDALVDRLGDPDGYLVSTGCMPTATHPVADAARRVLEYQGTAAQRVLLDRVDDPVRMVAWHVQRLVPRVGPTPEVLAHYRALLKHADLEKRSGAVLGLEDIGEPAEPMLYRVAADTKEDPAVRRLAVNALARVGGSDRSIELIRKLTVHPDEHLRRAATYALKEFKRFPK